ncbi:Uncharacterised protein [Mycobacteroides abscessus subsp. abscessus]|nr:Uncharacterised protein [Mycobacteroides abscessus subsp. abscessus]
MIRNRITREAMAPLLPMKRLRTIWPWLSPLVSASGWTSSRRISRVSVVGSFGSGACDAFVALMLSPSRAGRGPSRAGPRRD